MIHLQKDERTKINGSIIEFGLGWDSRQEQQVGGFLGGLLSKFNDSNSVGITKAIDLDASAILYSGNYKVGEASFRTLSNLPEGVKHSGDNRTGSAKGEDEIITIDTTKLERGVTSIFLVINSYSGEPLSSISNTFCNIRADNQDTARMSLNTKVADNKTAVVMGRFYLKDGQWRFQNISEFTNGRVASDLQRIIDQYL